MKSVELEKTMNKLANPRTQLDLGDRHVNISNIIAKAAHGLTLAEKRIIACALATLDSKSGKDYNAAMARGLWSVKLVAADYMALFGLSRSNTYEQLKGAADSIIKKQIHLPPTGKNKIGEKFNWLGGYRYHEGEGWIEIGFTVQVAPHILAQRKNFTSYKLSRASALRSVYSWRLMECLMSWKSTGVWHVPIEEFHHAMDAAPSHKNDFGVLRQKVINPAIKELRDTENFIITCKPIKAGRKVASLIFEFEPNPQTSMFDGVSE
jgi:plasmid replication initiation protein